VPETTPETKPEPKPEPKPKTFDTLMADIARLQQALDATKVHVQGLKSWTGTFANALQDIRGEICDLKMTVATGVAFQSDVPVGQIGVLIPPKLHAAGPKALQTVGTRTDPTRTTVLEPRPPYRSRGLTYHIPKAPGKKSK